MIASQGKKGESWKFKLVPVYGIFLLNFKSGETDKVRTDLVIADRDTGEQKGVTSERSSSSFRYSTKRKQNVKPRWITGYII